ncbi:10245_t:CDS:2, partial [Ambispora gerdemannii]
WLPAVYLPSVRVLGRNNVNLAESQYRRELQEAIATCEINCSQSKQKLEDILSHLTPFPRSTLLSVSGCARAIHFPASAWASHSMLGLVQRQRNYEDSWGIEKEKIWGTIEPEAPIASGVVDLTGSGDTFANLLSLETRQFLTRHSFHNNEIPEQIGIMTNEFVSTYNDLSSDFDPVLMRPISFPQGEMTLETRRILMTVFDLLEGLRHIWSCRPLLTEDDY